MFAALMSIVRDCQVAYNYMIDIPGSGELNNDQCEALGNATDLIKEIEDFVHQWALLYQELERMADDDLPF